MWEGETWQVPDLAEIFGSRLACLGNREGAGAGGVPFLLGSEFPVVRENFKTFHCVSWLTHPLVSMHNSQTTWTSLLITSQNCSCIATAQGHERPTGLIASRTVSDHCVGLYSRPGRTP